jgi:peptidoglycan hydrolase-like protein with peptidoglycan-binding domain
MGATGAEVTELQKALTASGFYTGPVSGYFGPLTQSAVKAFQTARGLAAVGNVGPQTRAALNARASVTPQTNNTAAIISALQAQLQVLLAQLALLQAKGT